MGMMMLRGLEDGKVIFYDEICFEAGDIDCYEIDMFFDIRDVTRVE